VAEITAVSPGGELAGFFMATRPIRGAAARQDLHLRSAGHAGRRKRVTGRAALRRDALARSCWTSSSVWNCDVVFA
jgi:hypothetical protein